MGRLIPEFEFRQEAAFVQEAVSARNLLGFSVKTIREAPFLETTLDPVLTMASIGVEKLHKLALGALEVDRAGTWLSKAQMRRHGHHSLSMNRELMAELKSRADGSTPFVREAIEKATGSAVASPLLTALDIYGDQGRFYYLDLLGDSPQDWIGPLDAWAAIEGAAFQDPALAALRDESFGDLGNDQKFNTMLEASGASIAATLEAIWDAITVSGRNHLLGRCGEILGFEAHRDAVGRQ
jgi:hypothetical protein